MTVKYRSHGRTHWDARDWSCEIPDAVKTWVAREVQAGIKDYLKGITIWLMLKENGRAVLSVDNLNYEMGCDFSFDDIQTLSPGYGQTDSPCAELLAEKERLKTAIDKFSQRVCKEWD